MSKLSNAFGDTSSVRVKPFSIGNCKFNVRIPTTREMELLHERIFAIDDAQAQARFDKMTSGMTPSETVVIDENDVVVDGRSTRELVRTVIMMEQRITEYVRLLVPVNGSMDDITYADIEDEWPMPVQLEIYDQISEIVSPGYKASRKN